ncbi:PQQ-binding-like beta-propeller repeat protein [bacterium]|nr:PQQ-binding-like beta-propeller repeat protein [bacterium]
MRRPAFLIFAALLLCYCGYLLWYFQIEPRRGIQRIIWRMQTGIWNQAAFQVAPDGSVILMEYNELRCHEPDGSTRWTSGSAAHVSVNGSVPATPSSFALAPQNGVYLVELSYTAQNTVSGSTRLDLRRLDSSGKQIWSSSINSKSMLSSSQTFAFAGGVVVHDDAGGISIYDLDGKQTGSQSPGGAAAGIIGEDQLAVSPAGQIYRIESGQGLSCYDSSGALIWQHKDATTQAWLCYCAVNSLLYFANGQDLLALNSTDGSVIWRSALPVSSYDSPRLCCTSGGQAVALNSSGGVCLYDDKGSYRELVRFDPARLSHLSPGGRDQLIVCDSSEGVSAIDLSGTTLWNVRQLRNVMLEPMLGADGRLYVVSNGFLYCLQP